MKFRYCQPCHLTLTHSGVQRGFCLFNILVSYKIILDSFNIAPLTRYGLNETFKFQIVIRPCSCNNANF